MSELRTEALTVFCTLKAETWSTPAYSQKKGIIAAADRSGTLFCFGAENGRQLWQKHLGPCITASPVFADVDQDGQEEILIGVQDTGDFFCLKPNGTVLWQQHCGSSIRATAAVADANNDGKKEVFISGYGNHMYCLEGATGKKIWQSFLGKHLYSGALGVVSSPLVADVDGDGRLEVVTGTRNKMMLCLDAESGRKKWFNYIRSDPDSSPALAWIGSIPYVFIGGGEFVNGYGDLSMHAVNGITGKTIWKTKINGGLDSSPVIVDINNDGRPEVIITSLADHSCFAFDAEAGDICWQTPFPKSNGCQHEKGICFTKKYYRTADAICRSYTTPLILEDENGSKQVMVGSNNGFIMRLNGVDGTVLSTRQTGAMARGSMISMTNKAGETQILISSGNKLLTTNLDFPSRIVKHQFTGQNNGKTLKKAKLRKFRSRFSRIKFFYYLYFLDLFRSLFISADVRLRLPFKLTEEKKRKQINVQ